MERHKQQQRQQQLARVQQHRSKPVSALHRAWLRGSSLATDHLRNVLILSVFGFKVGRDFSPLFGRGGIIRQRVH